MSLSIPGGFQGFQRQSDGKGRTSSPNPQDSGVTSANLPIFFLALGLVDLAAGGAWNLHPEATGVVVFFPTGQSSRRDQCAGPGPGFSG